MTIGLGWRVARGPDWFQVFCRPLSAGRTGTACSDQPGMPDGPRGRAAHSADPQTELAVRISPGCSRWFRAAWFDLQAVLQLCSDRALSGPRAGGSLRARTALRHASLSRIALQATLAHEAHQPRRAAPCSCGNDEHRAGLVNARWPPANAGSSWPAGRPSAGPKDCPLHRVGVQRALLIDR